MRLLSVALDLLAELVSPWRCSACGIDVARNHAFCVPCAVTITPARHTDVGIPLGSLGEYGGALEVAVHALKFGDRPDLARPLGMLLSSHGAAILAGCDVLVPVPLGRSRLLTRRYNQAALLARAIGRGAGIPVMPRALRRIRETAPQATLDRPTRLENVADAFAARALMTSRRVVLVDDVITTGATLRAVAAAVERAGGQVVGALVVAIAA